MGADRIKMFGSHTPQGEGFMPRISTPFAMTVALIVVALFGGRAERWDRLASGHEAQEQRRKARNAALMRWRFRDPAHKVGGRMTTTAHGCGWDRTASRDSHAPSCLRRRSRET